MISNHQLTTNLDIKPKQKMIVSLNKLEIVKKLRTLPINKYIRLTKYLTKERNKKERNK